MFNVKGVGDFFLGRPYRIRRRGKDKTLEITQETSLHDGHEEDKQLEKITKKEIRQSVENGIKERGSFKKKWNGLASDSTEKSNKARNTHNSLDLDVRVPTSKWYLQWYH